MHPQGNQSGPTALFLKRASQVCSQLRKFCHSKMYVLTLKPQGGCFPLPFGRLLEDGDGHPLLGCPMAPNLKSMGLPAYAPHCIIGVSKA